MSSLADHVNRILSDTYPSPALSGVMREGDGANGPTPPRNESDEPEGHQHFLDISQPEVEETKEDSYDDLDVEEPPVRVTPPP